MVQSRLLRSTLALAVLLLGARTYAHAQGGCVTGSTSCASAPEIDPSLGSAGATLLAGAILVIRARRRS